MLYSIIVIILISVLAILLGTKLSKFISAPIEKLKNIIYFLAKKQDLSKRLKVDTKDELGEIAQALNTLLANLQGTMQEAIQANNAMQLAKQNALNPNIEQNSATNNVSNATADVSATMDNLQLLANRLTNLSDQFKIFEAESERTSGW